MAANYVHRTYGYEARTRRQVVREFAGRTKETPTATHELVAAGVWRELYSVRSACMGSMVAARRAGMMLAMQAATASVMVAKIITPAPALVIS